MQSITKTQVTLMTTALGYQEVGRECNELKCGSYNHDGSDRNRGGFLVTGSD